MRQKRLCALLPVVVLFHLTAVDLSAQEGNCDLVLLQRNVDTADRSERTRMYWLRLVTQENFEQAKQAASGSAMYGAFFAEGSYSSFNQKRNAYLSKEVRDESREATESTLIISLPPGAVEAWSKCKEAHAKGKGLIAWLVNVTDETATLALAWEPAPGLGSLTLGASSIQGGELPPTLGSGKTLPRGTAQYVLRMSSNGAPISGSINGSVGSGSTTGNYSAAFFIPHSLPPPPPPKQFNAIYLDQVQEKNSDNIRVQLCKNCVYWQNNGVFAGGNRYYHALGMHPKASGDAFAEYEVPSGAKLLKGHIGHARQDSNQGCAGSFSWSVLLDGYPVGGSTWHGGWTGAPVAVNTPVRGGQIVRLVTNALGDNNCDHATWLDMEFRP